MTTPGHTWSPASTVALVAGAAFATAASWWAWLGWDDRRYDVATDRWVQDPDPWWQVAGCVLTLVAIGAVASWLLRPGLAALAVALGIVGSLAMTVLHSYPTFGLVWLGVLMIAPAAALVACVFGFVMAARQRHRPLDC